MFICYIVFEKKNSFFEKKILVFFYFRIKTDFLKIFKQILKNKKICILFIFIKKIDLFLKKYKTNALISTHNKIHIT